MIECNMVCTMNRIDLEQWMQNELPGSTCYDVKTDETSNEISTNYLRGRQMIIHDPPSNYTKTKSIGNTLSNLCEFHVPVISDDDFESA